MRTKIWMFCVFVFLIYIAPVLMIMMWLVLFPTPVHYAFYYWLPFALLGTPVLYFWYKNQGAKPED